MIKYSDKVLDEFLSCQPPHLSLVRAIEACYYSKYLPLKGKILDVGCGDGFFAQSVFNKQSIDVGIDVEGSLWHEAKMRTNYKTVKVYDGYKIPFEDSYFDTVISNCVLEHVEDVDILIKEMSRVTKSNGNLLITVVTKDFGSKLFFNKILGSNYSRWFNQHAVHVANKSVDDWLRSLTSKGFEIKETKQYLNSSLLMKFFDLSHYWGLINILSRKILGKWVWGPSRISNWMWKKAFEKVALKAQDSDSGDGCLFVVAYKKPISG